MGTRPLIGETVVAANTLERVPVHSASVGARLASLSILLGLAFTVTACSTSTHVNLPPRAKLLSPDQVHSRIRRFADLPAERRLASCNGLVFVGRTYPAPGSGVETIDEIVLADGPALYFDNRSGRKIADCSYWFCTRNSALCKARCPLPEWTCLGVELGRPETEAEARERARGIIKTPSKAEIGAIEKGLEMPAGANSMPEYFRYYYAVAEYEKRWIIGKYIAVHLMPSLKLVEGEGGLGVEDEAAIPHPAGEGCELVFVKYDPQARAVTSIDCAGGEAGSDVGMRPNKSLEQTREG